jgi:hypothetical protein
MCGLDVEVRLAKFEGVISASVNLVSKTASVIYDNELVNVRYKASKILLEIQCLSHCISRTISTVESVTYRF